MNTGLVGLLIHALAVIGLVVAIWLVLSPPAFIAKLAFAALGALTFPGRAIGLAKRYGSVGVKFDEFLKRCRTAADLASQRSAVRVVLDERHARLRDALKGAEGRVREAVANVEGIASAESPRAVLKDVDELRERTKLVDRIGVEIDGDIADQYAARSRTHMTLTFGIFFVLLFALANGMLLNMFFRDLIAIRLFGVPASLLLSVMAVLVEMALGFLLAWVGRQPGGAPVRWLFIVAIAIAAGFEAVVLGLVSNEFEIDLPLFDLHPMLKLWMAPFGLVLTTATSATGYMVHKTLDELAEHAGAAKLRKELLAVTRFVRELPTTWETIDQKAQRARASIDSYLLTLKGKSGDLSGIVKGLKQEREAFSETLLTVQPTAWPSLLDGETGDRRAAAAQNLAIFLISAAAVVAYACACIFLLGTAIGDRMPAIVSLGAGVSLTLAFYVIGWLALQRLQLIEGDNGRTYPVRAGVLEYAVAGAMVLGCAVGLLWAATAALGGVGVIVGLMLLGVGLGGIGFAGYLAERAGRGLAMTATLALLLGFFAIEGLFAATCFLLIWLVAILAWVVSTVLSLLAKPTELIVEAFKRRAAAATPANAPA